MERNALQELRAEWETINHNLFGNFLSAPVFLWSNATAVMGAWHRKTRELEISRHALWDLPWTAIIEILKHETAHQYVDEHLEIYDETAHGPTFRRVCADRGIDCKRALTSHQPFEAPKEMTRNRRLARKISGLLALAGSANIHEAQSAMNAAGRLMLKYNIESDQLPGNAGYMFCHLGNPTGRVRESQKILANLLVRFFFVKAVWIPVYRPKEGKRGSVLEICGEPHNLEIAAFVHDFLNDTAERLWVEHKKEKHVTSNRDRLRFHAGVMNGFHHKLEQQGKLHQEKGLIRVGDPGLESYFNHRFPSTIKIHGRRKKIYAAYAHGHEAGKSIVLHRTIHKSGAGGKMLSPVD